MSLTQDLLASDDFFLGYLVSRMMLSYLKAMPPTLNVTRCLKICLTGSAIVFARKGIPPFVAETPSEICMLLNFLTLFLFYIIQIKKNGNFCRFLFRFLKVSSCKIFV